MAQNNSFYSTLRTFTDFSDLLNNSHYVPVPRDWWILITDIQGSTKAIQKGQYKEVNMLGAASITCLLNTNKELDLPFVFGGDGSTLLVPDSVFQKSLDELKKLKRLAHKEFNLNLRVGAVSLSSPLMQNQSLSVAKYELTPGNCIAQFKGSALSYAEQLIKSKSSDIILLPDASDGSLDVNLEGLSCRLSPIKSRHGKIISLICQATKNSTEQMSTELIKKIYQILNNDFSSANPAHLKQLKWSLFSNSLFTEIKLRKGNHSFLRQLFKTLKEMLLANILIKTNASAGGFSAKKYKSEIITNSDFKKFDEVLRMVLDCTPKQIQSLQQLLEEYEAQGKIIYGTHVSDQSLMTCMVFSSTQNQHTHFIDGAGGGYAFAAMQFKEKKAEREKSLV